MADHTRFMTRILLVSLAWAVAFTLVGAKYFTTTTLEIPSDSHTSGIPIFSTDVNVSSKTLPSGAQIPVVGLGVYQALPGVETYDAVLSALKLGYRHFDTAEFYWNEKDVGRAIRDSGIPRKDIFVTSKLFPSSYSYEKALASARASNAKLGLGYIDLYLLHAPGDPSPRAEAWRALETLQKEGAVKDIGVSNFGEAHLEKLKMTAKVKPAANQIELHPWLMRPVVVKYCEGYGILLEAYSPLARAQKTNDPILVDVANEVAASPAQVLVAFSLANDFIPLPKSVHADRQKEIWTPLRFSSPQLKLHG